MKIINEDTIALQLASTSESLKWLQKNNNNSTGDYYSNCESEALMYEN